MFHWSSRTLMAAAALLVIGTLGCAPTASAADQKTELTLAEFRALVRGQVAAEQTPSKPARGDKRAEVPSQLPRNDGQVDRAFLRLLAAQGEEAAARQSLDRLAGWTKAAEARVQAQGAPSTDLDVLRYAASRAVASVARFESQRLEAVKQANLLLKRPPGTPLVAAMEGAAPATPESAAAKEAASPAAPGQKPALPEVNPDIASRKALYEKDLLPAGEELLGKLYQSYLFGGITVETLLWQEQQAYRTETEYRMLLVEGERPPSVP